MHVRNNSLSMQLAHTTLGRYQIHEEIGAGAMGVVYRGTDPLLERSVAIKTIRIDVTAAERDEFKKRFFREAKSAGKLNHPNIVTVYDAGETDNVAYIAMELLEGDDLRAHISLSERMAYPRAAEVIADVARALHYAHSEGVVHRDVKPGNIMILNNGVVKLADFGIARLASGSATQTGQMFGTPKYMAPEQIAGKQADARTDIFSLGIVLYQLITGIAPFDGDSFSSIMFRVMQEPALAPSDLIEGLPRGFEYVLSKALAKDPVHRYQSAQQMESDLRNLALSRTVEPLPWGVGGIRSRHEGRVKDPRDHWAPTAFEPSRAPAISPAAPVPASVSLTAALDFESRPEIRDDTTAPLPISKPPPGMSTRSGMPSMDLDGTIAVPTIVQVAPPGVTAPVVARDNAGAPVTPRPAAAPSLAQPMAAGADMAARAPGLSSAEKAAAELQRAITEDVGKAVPMAAAGALPARSKLDRPADAPAKSADAKNASPTAKPGAKPAPKPSAGAAKAKKKSSKTPLVLAGLAGVAALAVGYLAIKDPTPKRTISAPDPVSAAPAASAAASESVASLPPAVVAAPSASAVELPPGMPVPSASSPMPVEPSVVVGSGGAGAVAGAASGPAGDPSAPAASTEGRMSFGVTPWGEVFVDGVSKGVSPPLTELKLPAGTYRVQIRNGDFKPIEQSVTIEAGKRRRVSAKF